MAASPYSQETVSQFFERNYVPVLWHQTRKCIEEMNVASGFEFQYFCQGVATGPATALMPWLIGGFLHGVCMGIIRTALMPDPDWTPR
jgi:hypothetical protein